MNRKDYIENLKEQIITAIISNGGEKLLTSIIFTGSFGRNEPTFSIGKNGELLLKSDVEIALVYSKRQFRKEILKLVEETCRLFNEDLNLMPMTERRIIKRLNFNFDLTSPSKKTLFTYDLYNGSYTIWGKDYLIKNTVTLDDVDPYEAKRIVANRIGELIYNSEIENAGAYVNKQWKAKVMLAIVTAWLLLNKRYSSSFHEQHRQAQETREELGMFGPNFFEDYNACFMMLRENGEEYDVNENSLRAYIAIINELFKTRKLNSPKVNGIVRLLKYTLKYIRTERKYGITGFENRILQSLIDEYINKDINLRYTADIWHKTIY